MRQVRSWYESLSAALQHHTTLQQADKSAEATPFIGFMLDALFTAMVEVAESDAASSEKNSV